MAPAPARRRHWLPCPALLPLVHLACLASAHQGGRSVSILKPADRSVVRRQSVEVEVESDAATDGQGHRERVAVFLDSVLAGEVEPGGRVSLILADESVGEGVHDVRATLLAGGGEELASSSSTFHFARNFQPSAFGHSEIFLHSPHDGQLLLRRDGGLDVAFSVTGDVEAGCMAVVSIDGETVSETRVAEAGGGRVSLFVEQCPVGRHEMHILLYGGDEEFLGVEAGTAFEIAQSLPLVPPTTLSVEKLDIALAVLVSAGPRTLARTLRSFQRILPQVSQLVVFVQEREEELFEIAESFTPHVFGFDSKIGKGNAWLYMATAASAKFIIFVEEDFNLIENASISLHRLRGAVELLSPHAGSQREGQGSAESVCAPGSAVCRPNGVHVVRLRHRKRPGDPLWVERSFFGSQRVDESHLLHYMHFASFTYVHYPDALWLCSRNPTYVCAPAPHAGTLVCVQLFILNTQRPSRRYPRGLLRRHPAVPIRRMRRRAFPQKYRVDAHDEAGASRTGHLTRQCLTEYTNNPSMYVTEWARDVLGPILSKDNYNTMERRVRPWWLERDIVIAQGDGLFEHDRLDGMRVGQAESDVDAGTGADQMVVQLPDCVISIALVVSGEVLGRMQEHVQTAGAGCADAGGWAFAFEVVIIGEEWAAAWAQEGRRAGLGVSVFSGWGVALLERLESFDVVHVGLEGMLRGEDLAALERWPLIVTPVEGASGCSASHAPTAAVVCEYNASTSLVSGGRDDEDAGPDNLWHAHRLGGGVDAQHERLAPDLDEGSSLPGGRALRRLRAAVCAPCLGPAWCGVLGEVGGTRYHAGR